MMKTTTIREVMDAVVAPTHDEISARAYELYMERPVDAGTDVDDWLRAERELLDARLNGAVFNGATTSRRRATRLAVEHDLASK
jgi:hypothetical protein